SAGNRPSIDPKSSLELTALPCRDAVRSGAFGASTGGELPPPSTLQKITVNRIERGLKVLGWCDCTPPRRWRPFQEARLPRRSRHLVRARFPGRPRARDA